MLLTWPTSSELLEIEQDLIPSLTADDLAFDLMPMTNHDAPLVEWEQMDNFTGLMQVRGPDGEPPSAPNVGFKRLRMEPGVYGEWTKVNETDILFRRQPGTFNVPIRIDDLVMGKQDYLLSRRLDRIRWIIWTLLITGAFNVPGPNGSVLHAGSFAVQQVVAPVVWSDYTNSKPLADMRAAPLKFRGITASFGPNAVAVMNLVTFNHMVANNNPNDLGKTRTNMGATLNNLANINEVLVSNDLPRIVVYERGYFPDGGGAWTPFIPDGKVVLLGQRPSGATIGEFQMTRNAVNPDGAPGPYTEVTDSLDTGRKVPRNVRVDDGFNGGPAMFYPSLDIVLTVL